MVENDPGARLADQAVEYFAKNVENDPDYRVLRRFKPRPAYNAAIPGLVLHQGLFLDLETTSLDVDVAEVIELGATRFKFDETGRIYTVEPAVSYFEQPSAPIPEEITELTGITDEMVYGKVIESADMDTLMDGVELTIAHNADYDRKIAERRWKFRFEHLAWACSQKQIDWKARGSIGSKLGNVLMTTRSMFYEAHRAGDDTLVGVDILTHERQVAAVEGLPPVHQTALSELLDTTRSGVYRVYANDSPFERKGELKSRGYFWTGEKPWKRDFTTIEAAEEELAWLDRTNLSFRPAIKRIKAKDRYSVREETHAVPLQSAAIERARAAKRAAEETEAQAPI